MADLNNIQDRIEAYLNGQLKRQDLAAFENEMQSDPAFKDQVKISKEIQNQLSDNTFEFAANLQDIRNDFDSKVRKEEPSKLKWLLLLIPILFLGSYWLFNNLYSENDKVFGPQKESVDEIKENSSTILESKDEVEKDKNLKENQESKINKEETKTNTKKQKAVKPQLNTEPVSVPIAMADYEPNKSLDILIGSSTRGEILDISVENEIQDQFISNDEPIRINLDFLLSTDSTFSEGDILFYIFDNKESSYNAFNPLHESDATLEKIDDGYRFRVRKNIMLKPGLYYYFIETIEEDLLYINKFSIKSK